MTRLYPVAPTPEGALHARTGLAARETEALRLAGGPVAFETALVGPAFTSREAAAQAYAGRTGGDGPGLASWCELRPVLAEGAPRPPPARPVLREGRRWPEPDPASPAALWRLSVSYWRSGGMEGAEPLAAARLLRRDAAAPALGADDLRRLSSQPLRPVRVQRALDVDLFETRLPENPARLIPDE